MTTPSGKPSLADTHPDLAAQAVGWDPNTVTAGSHAKLPWRCAMGHGWSAIVGNRARLGAGCPYCAGQAVLPGFNDLATTHPDLAKEAQFDVTTTHAGTERKLPWQCDEGHRWNASVSNRSRLGAGCPVCAGLLVLPGVNDLATTHPELAAEAEFDPSTLSGGSHKKVPWRCMRGHRWSATVGNRVRGDGCPYCGGKAVLPGFNDLATTHPELAKEALFDPTTVTFGSSKKVPWRCTLGHDWSAPTSRRASGRGCPYCAGQAVLPGFNDLATTHPDLAKEALFDATSVTAGASPSLLWQCALGHVWRAQVARRAGPAGRGCPVCSGNQVLIGFNDLATTHPLIASEAQFDPTSVTAGSGKKRLWRCLEGHEWIAAVGGRTGGRGCPTCSLTGYDPNARAWMYLLHHPEWQLQQVGITNRPKRRLATHAARGWEAVDVRGPMDGYLAREWERSILDFVRSRGALLPAESPSDRFDGYTEAWRTNEFEARSIRELMDSVEQAEDSGGRRDRSR